MKESTWREPTYKIHLKVAEAVKMRCNWIKEHITENCGVKIGQATMQLQNILYGHSTKTTILTFITLENISYYGNIIKENKVDRDVVMSSNKRYQY